ncbi:His-Xaa-Ser system protein HxsD [Thauera sp. ZXT1-4]|uniref:His-Xaa-Ser system protein HxsD n=1 Tax=Thauera sp. ZXT1-4 TaxID=3460294 RepID=UPI004040777E
MVVEIDASLFDRAAIFKTAYWGTERAFLYLTQDKDAGRIYAELRPKKPDATDLETVAREFCNALIDQQTRQIVLRETSAERDVLLTKAFGAGRGHLDLAEIA